MFDPIKQTHLREPLRVAFSLDLENSQTHGQDRNLHQIVSIGVAHHLLALSQGIRFQELKDQSHQDIMNLFTTELITYLLL